MPDIAVQIPVVFETREIKTDEDAKSSTRFIINRITGAYNIDTNLSLYLYFKRSNAMSWESVGPFTISSTVDRFAQRIHPVLSVIDYYVKITGSVTSTCDITSLKVWQKILPLGKHI
jgi:hypothetical protein